jgi:alkyl hydroperoxide reductase subunit D
MAMNNVYYRFRRIVGKPIYGEKPGGAPDEPADAAGHQSDRLRAHGPGGERDQRLRDVRAHEKTVTEGGLTPDHVNDAVRIAATIYAAAVALGAGAEAPAPEVAAPGV